MIRRKDRVKRVVRLLREFPVVGLVGARQTGKTTLARLVSETRAGPTHQFDLESPIDRGRLGDPMLALESLRGLVILDEVQLAPRLFSVLRVLADRRPIRARFLVLGSAAPEMLQQSSESLAGRIAFEELEGFALSEVGVANLGSLWLRGGLPPAFLAQSNAAASRWLGNYVRTFLERDLPMLGVRVSSTTLERFWSMLAHYHGQTWNASEFARSFGVSDHAVRRYLDVLTSALVVRQLKPFVANLRKRQVKAPKVYLRDSGVLHQLLGITSRVGLERHPKVGASWEGFALSNVIDVLQADPRECHFWATHAGAELDLLVGRGERRIGFEFKRSSAPTLTKSMRIAVDDLGLKQLWVVHAGRDTYPMAERIQAIPLKQAPHALKPF